MASSQPRGQRDIVYCHECENEWYRDEHGLTCPDCQSDFTEIVGPTHDPRAVDMSDFDEDIPDPDEDDISNLFVHPNAARSGHPDQQPANSGHTYQPAGGLTYRTTQHFHGDMPPMLQGMAGILGNIMGRGFAEARMGTTSGSPGQSENTARQGQPATSYVQTIDRPGFHFEIRTSTSSNFNQQTFRGPSGSNQTFGTNAQHDPRDDFFASLGQFGPIFSTLFPDAAASRDYAFTQEGFDRIISNLMEQEQSGNAPGPASAEAIASLPTRSITMKDLGSDGKAECSICMEEVSVGTTVTELPCHHWFHGECIKAWLVEHDTCPHCRQGIMAREGEGTANRARTPHEAPRHDQMWGQGTQDDPWVIPDSPAQDRPSAGRRFSRSSRGSTGRRPSDTSGLLNRMRNAFGGGRSNDDA